VTWKSTVLGLLAGAGLAASAQTSLAAQGDSTGLGGVIVDLRAVGDSGSYLRYDYIVRNPGSSSWAIAVVRMDLTAPRGTGTKTLPATGRFRHGAAMRGSAPLIDHVPAGPISPESWQSWLLRDGFLDWYGLRNRGAQNLDSIAPGASLSGFGIRSTYLPGIRSVWAEPTWQSCCSRPRPPQPDVPPEEHPSPDEFRVKGLTVGPTLHPDSVSIQVLQAFHARTCTELRWITDAGVCASLGATLGRVRQAVTQADRTGTRTELRSFVSELEAQHGVGRPVNDNAYWLLRVNAEFLLRRLE
jgi:hypothetical protein